MSVREPEWLACPWQDLVGRSRVPFEVLPDADALMAHMAAEMAAELRANNAAGRPTRWILPVGPTGQYPYLVEIINRERLSLANLHSFQMDEYLDWTTRLLPSDHPLSFLGALHEKFFERIDADLRQPAGQHHRPDPCALDDLSAAIAAVGGVDTCWGGIGVHGHVAFNEAPPTYYGDIELEEFALAPTRIVALQPDTLVVNGISGAGGNFEAVPPYAVTIGMNDILAAGRIRLCAHRQLWARAIWRRAVMQAPTVRYPVTLIGRMADAKIYVDEKTAAPAAVGH